MKKGILLLILFTLIMMTGCQTKPTGNVEANNQSKQVNQKNLSRMIVESFEGKSLKNNMLDEVTSRNLTVYLPPSYYTSDKRYPVIYFLHGFQETPDYIQSIQNTLDEQFQNNPDKEFILVEPDANNYLGGSFYVNSPVTGNWEDYIVKDVINYVDNKYRTISNAASRGISGFSMGGFGAFNLILRHPDIFSSAYVMSPGAFDENGLQSAMTTWDQSFLSAYGAAFSPDLKGEYPYANIPQFDGTPSDNRIVKDWENGFGNLKEKIEAYKKLNQPLKAIKIVVGESDFYGWIFDGSYYLSELLKNEGINNEYGTFVGNHEIEPGFAEGKLVEFFSKNLKME